MSRELLIEAEGLLRAAQRQSEELERLLARVERSMSRPAAQAPAAPAPEEPAPGAAGVSRAPTGNAA